MTKNIQTQQYLMFTVSGLLFAMETRFITEIVASVVITKIPLIKKQIQGIIHLRGDFISVLDLSLRLDLEHNVVAKQHSIVIVDIPVEEKTIKIGIFVDEVFDINDIDIATLMPSPKKAVAIRGDFVEHLFLYRERDAFVLKMETVFDIEALSQLEGFDESI